MCMYHSESFIKNLSHNITFDRHKTEDRIILNANIFKKLKHLRNTIYIHEKVKYLYALQLVAT